MPHVILPNCIKCAACLPECPTSSIAEGKSQYLIDADTCGDCAACVAVCPVDVIKPRGASRSPDRSTEAEGKTSKK